LAGQETDNVNFLLTVVYNLCVVCCIRYG